MEDKTREGRIRKTRKDVVVCVQDVVGKKNFVVKSEDMFRLSLGLAIQSVSTMTDICEIYVLIPGRTCRI